MLFVKKVRIPAFLEDSPRILYAIEVSNNYRYRERVVEVYRTLVGSILLVLMLLAVVSVCGCPKTKSVEEYEKEKPPGFVPPMPPGSTEAEGEPAAAPQPEAKEAPGSFDAAPPTAPEAEPEKAPAPEGQ